MMTAEEVIALAVQIRALPMGEATMALSQALGQEYGRGFDRARETFERTVAEHLAVRT